MLLEGTGRKKENTYIRCDASTAEQRKQNREEAEAIYHARMTQLARGRVGLPNPTKTTFAKFSDWYKEHHIAKHRGAIRERWILKHLRGHFDSFLLSEITPARWTEYETERRKAGAAPNTIARELALMKTMLAAAVGEHIDVSPLAHTKRRTERLPAKRTITAAEEKKLLKAFNDDELRDMYLVGVGTLLRQQNIVQLQRKQLHGSRLVVQTKTGPHAIDLTGPTELQTRVAMVLKRRLPKTHDGYFFPRWQERFNRMDDEGEGHPRAWFLKVVRRAASRADIPWGLRNHGVVWHTLTRASGATRLLREHGVDVRTVQLLGNWRSLDQMAEYLGVDLGQSGHLLGTEKPILRTSRKVRQGQEKGRRLRLTPNR